jgi:hypothetical protein
MAMSERGRRALGLAVAAAAALLAACSPAPAPVSVVPVDRAGCAAEAVLLAEPAPLRAAPSERAPVLRTLAAGQPVYLCGEAAGFRSILLPSPGAPAACRGSDAIDCVTGWLPRSAATEIAG